MLYFRIHALLLFCIVPNISLGNLPTKEFEVRLTGASSSDDLANLAVYSRKSGGGLTRLGATDQHGVIKDEYQQARDPGNTEYYFVLPQNPSRWKISKATSRALPSNKALFADGSMLANLSERVKAKWVETADRPALLTKPLPPRGTVRLKAQDALGVPIANHAVQLFGRIRPSHDREAVVWSGMTDSEGVVTLRQFQGNCNWLICFPGLGYTQTGQLVVDGGSTNEIQLPRATPYAEIRGKVHESLLQDLSSTGRVFLASESAWRYREAEISPEGEFCISDVAMGNYQVRLTSEKTQRLRIDSLRPGEVRKGLVVEPVPKKDSPSLNAAQSGMGGSISGAGTKFTLRGRLIDVNGQGVKGAKLYAIAKYHGGIRMYQATKETTTNDQGEYEFKNVNFKFGTVALVAHVAGRPLAIGAGGYSGPTEDTALLVGIGGPTIGTTPQKPFSTVLNQRDLILPAIEQGGQLRVSTLQEGMSLERVVVKLELMDFHRSFSPGWAAGRMPDSLKSVLTPSEQTDANGEAFFENLTPGLYRITATPTPKAGARTSVSGPSWTRTAPERISHVSVAAGESRSVQMTVSDVTTAVVPFRIQHTNGVMLSNTSTSTSWVRPLDGGGRSSGSKIDAQEIGTFNLREPGLWRLSVRYLTPSIGAKTVPVRTEPSYAAVQYVAVSRLAPRGTPVTFRSQLIAPATITAQIEDENGAPAQGVVSLDVGRYGGFHGQKVRFGSTDAYGKLQFERVHSGTHKLKATIPDWSTSAASIDAKDSELSQQFAVPEQVVDVASGELLEVRLRRQQVAYVRGQLVPTPDADEKIQFNLIDNWTRRPLDTNIDWSRQTGEFILGPVLPGKHQVAVQRYRNGKIVTTVNHTFHVKSPGIHREDIAYHPTKIPETRGVTSRICGTVYAADGKTPIYAARLAAYSPGLAVSHAGTWSNAQGNFCLHAQPYRMLQAGEETDPDGSPRQPAIVTRLPGKLGATVSLLPKDITEAPLEELKIVLPKRAELHGKVTVAGKSPQALPAVIRVLAQHRGRGKLNPILSVMGTANIDGSFQLNGLTPGKYDVQACLDGIWTSASQTLVVHAVGPFNQTMDFNVPTPGDIAQYRLLDQRGRPVANQPVRIKALVLDGPFSKSIRPTTEKTDSNGVLYLEGMPAGELTAELVGKASQIGFRVPPLGSPMSDPFDLRVK